MAVVATLEPAEIRVGDVAHLTVVVEHPAAGALELPDLDRGKAIVVRDRERATLRLPGERESLRERTTCSFRLTSFAVGEHRLSAGKVRFVDPGGRTLEAAFPGAMLRTRSVLPGENTPLRGIKGLARWPKPGRRWAAPAAGILLLAAAAFLGARRWRAGRRRRPPPAAPPAAPHETALVALAALRGAGLIRQHRVEPFYRQLSAILRSYLESRFGLRAPEQTTEEFIREATVSGRLAAAHRETLRVFLEQCDLVKFARHRPSPDDMTRALDAAERLVRETIPPAGP